MMFNLGKVALYSSGASCVLPSNKIVVTIDGTESYFACVATQSSVG